MYNVYPISGGMNGLQNMMKQFQENGGMSMGGAGAGAGAGGGSKRR